jgi:hypothetical protein
LSLEVDMQTLRLGSAILASLAFAACASNNASPANLDLSAAGGDDLSGPGGGDLSTVVGDGGVGGTGLNGSGTGCKTNADCTGGQICSSVGLCACPPYQDLCSGQCIPTANDAKNCGHCGVMCTGAAACYGGLCNPGGCPAGLTACSNACFDTQTDNNHCGNCATKCMPTAGGQQTGCINGSCMPIAGSVTGGPGACPGGGPQISVTGTGDCAGILASNTFTFALCSCSNINNTGSLVTDGFDSLKGPYPVPAPPWPFSLGAGVGANGNVSNDSTLNIGGALFCSGDANASSTANIRQDLYVGGNAGGFDATVAGDAFIHGTVGGALHVMGTVTKGVTVPPPCEYCPNQTPGPIDVAGIVTARVTNAGGTNNDNKTISLSDTLFSSGGGSSRLDLPCGNYYLDGITRDAIIYAHGHTALYVGTKGITAGNVTFSLDPTATFDIFVAGPINNSGTFTLGAQNYPALTRMYVAGTGALTFSSSADIFGNLYDAGHIGLSSGTTVYGALYAGSLDGTADLTIHYDRQVVVQGATCPPPTGLVDGGTGMGCGSCKDCNNQACINGMCADCTTDSDCCPPLICEQGMCLQPVK